MTKGVSPKANVEPLSPAARTRAVALVVGAYTAVAGVGLVIGTLRDAPNVFVCTPLRMSGSQLEAHLASLVGGIGLAIAVTAATRLLVRTQSWAAALHEDLRPVARSLGPEAVLPVALASSIGEEVLFRGALVPVLGVVVSSLVFGALHQLRGRSRLSWAIFAAVVGFLFAALFRVTGSLVGPIVAHAAINFVNLRFLIAHDPGRRDDLGGLLRR
ncbi:MAG: CPBP family intramembrane glutamic endopeptidase [Polyangiales bacterium]